MTVTDYGYILLLNLINYEKKVIMNRGGRPTHSYWKIGGFTRYYINGKLTAHFL